MRDADDFARHFDDVHFNSVKHGLARCASEWPYSSFRQAVARGQYPADWVHDEDDLADFGERETLTE